MTIIAGLDSSTSRPTPSQLQAAKAAGVQVWGGYLATRANVGLASPWNISDFDLVRQVLNTEPIAFCSGFDDPVALATLAKKIGVRLCLDDESGIRPTGGWEQGWLNAARGVWPTGFYGNAVLHGGISADFHILAAYPGSNPGASWPAGLARPSAPCGWQWEGTHSEFGCSVDRSWLDQFFAAPIIAPPPATPHSNWILRGKAVLNPTQGYLLDFFGGVHPYGGLPVPQVTGYWPGWDIARDIAIAPGGNGGIVLDGWGGLHPFAVAGGQPPAMPAGAPYWPGFDIARSLIITDWNPVQGYVIDGWFGQHPLGGAPPLAYSTYYPGGAY